MQAFCKKNTFLLYKCHKELEECVIYAALKLKIFQIWDPLKRDKKIASSNTLCCGTHFLILESCEIARGLLYLQKNSWKSKYFKIYNAKGQQISTFWWATVYPKKRKRWISKLLFCQNLFISHLY